MQKARFLTAFWALAKPYWVSPQRKKGLALAATVIGLSLAMVGLAVLGGDADLIHRNPLEPIGRLRHRRTRHTRLPLLDRRRLRRHRQLADACDRQTAHLARFQPAALRGRLSLLTRAAAREQRRRGPP